jgi:hypothetical protein
MRKGGGESYYMHFCQTNPMSLDKRLAMSALGENRLRTIWPIFRVGFVLGFWGWFGEAGGINCETNPILFKPVWKSVGAEAKNEPNLEGKPSPKPSPLSGKGEGNTPGWHGDPRSEDSARSGPEKDWGERPAHNRA